MSTPYAKLLVSVAGAAAASGGQTASAGDALTFSFESTVGWGSPAAKVEIYSYPSSFSAPAGWSTDAAGVIYYQGNTPPPGFTLSADAADWGKYLFRLTVLGGLLNGVAAAQLVDEASGISVASANGLKDVAYLEGTQFSSKSWPGAIQETIRAIDSVMSGGAIGVISVGATAPITSSGGTTPTIGIQAASAANAGSMSAAHFSLVDAATSSADPNTIPKRGASSECSFSSLDCTTLDASSTVTCAALDSAAALPIGGTNATSVTVGRAGITTALVGTVTVNSKTVEAYSNTAQTADYSAAFGDFIEATPPGGGITITAPDPTSNAGRGFTIFALNANSITISRAGKTFNGAASVVVTTQYAMVTVVALSDGNFAVGGV